VVVVAEDDKGIVTRRVWSIRGEGGPAAVDAGDP
jgi:hypothetical protein